MIKKRSRLTGKAARPLSLSLALLSFSIKTISGNLSHRGAHLHSLPGLLFIRHICVSVRVCEKLLSCYHRLFNLSRKFSWNLRPVLKVQDLRISWAIFVLSILREFFSSRVLWGGPLDRRDEIVGGSESQLLMDLEQQLKRAAPPVERHNDSSRPSWFTINRHSVAGISF